MTDHFPSAAVRKSRIGVLLWLFVIAAVLSAAVLAYHGWRQQGVAIVIQFDQGHGLKPGDALRYRGIEVGRVDEIALGDDLNGIHINAHLRREASELARDGSRFWIVRPRLELAGASGLETVIGAKYIQVLPGQGEPKFHFIGQEQLPLEQLLEPGGLDIVLTAESKTGLQQGAPVSYRQVEIGTVVKVDLSRDAGAVEAGLYIRPEYAGLIRENTVFWKIEGARWEAKVQSMSMSFEVDSLKTLLLGGIALAIPDDPGPPVRPGHVFRLYDEARNQWLYWRPSLPLDTEIGVLQPRPDMQLFRVEWSYKNFLYLTEDEQRWGWALPVSDGLLCPLDLLQVPNDALPASVHFRLESEAMVPGPVNAYGSGIGLVKYSHSLPVWPQTQQRSPDRPEDSWIVAGPKMRPRYIAAHRYEVTPETDAWLIDPDLPFDHNWHGAAVIAKADTRLIGMVLISKGQARVGLLPKTAISQESEP